MFGISLVAAACLANLPDAVATRSPGRLELKSLVARSLEEPPGSQRVSITNLKETGPVNVVIQYDFDIGGTRVQRMPTGDICVSIDRADAAKAFYLLDAGIVCSLSDSCSELPRYADLLLADGCAVPDLPLFEEIVVSSAMSLRDWRMEPGYATSWVESFHSLIMTFQFHELAHVVLGHSFGEQSLEPDAIYREEAEADGLAAYVSQLAGFSNLGASIFLLERMVNEKNLEVSTGAHPATACRWDLFRGNLHEWYDRHSKTVQKPDLSEIGRVLPAGSPDMGVHDFAPSEYCKDYAVGANAGVEKGILYFSKFTSIQSTDHPGKLCRDFFR